jgi:TonB dependent receptor.
MGNGPLKIWLPSEVGKPHIYASDALGRPYSPAWYQVDLSIRKQWGPLQLGVSLENISDQRYRPYSSGIVAAGRNLMLNAAYVW